MTLRAFTNLLMITAIAYAARSFVPAGQSITGSGAALAFGFLLIAALQIGFITDRLRLTSLTGYMLCGLLFGPEVLHIVSRPMLNDLAIVKGTAVGLIAFLAGAEMNFARLRPVMRAITSLSIVTMVFSAIVLWAFFFGITWLLPVTSGATFVERSAIALVCANVLAAFSPAVVIGVISETRSSGALTQLAIAVVVLADLAMVVTFAVSVSIARGVFPGGESAGGFSVLVQHIFGSIAIGAIVGLVLSGYLRRVRTRTSLVVFALLFIVAEAGRVLHLDPLLVGLTAGLLIENWSPVTGEEITRAAQPVTLPLFAIFFSVIGAEIQLHAFLHVAPIAIGAALLRGGAIVAGSRAGARIGRVAPATARLLPLALVPQAGVAIALSVLVLNEFAPWGRVLGTVLLGSIVVNQLAGPMLLRFALSSAGEMNRATATDAQPTPAPV